MTKKKELLKKLQRMDFYLNTGRVLHISYVIWIFSRNSFLLHESEQAMGQKIQDVNKTSMISERG